MAKLEIDYDSRTTPTYLINLSEEIYHTTLSPTIEQTLLIPAGARRCILSWTPGNHLFVTEGNTPITLPGATFTTTDAMLNVQGLYDLVPNQLLRFISPESTTLSVAFYNA